MTNAFGDCHPDPDLTIENELEYIRDWLRKLSDHIDFVASDTSQRIAETRAAVKTLGKHARNPVETEIVTITLAEFRALLQSEQELASLRQLHESYLGKVMVDADTYRDLIQRAAGVSS